MNVKDIKKFNLYCAEVMGYDGTDLIKDDAVYDPYYNIYQLAAVVEELINLTGKHPAALLGSTTHTTWRVWSNYVINTMLDEGLGPLESKVMLELATYEDGVVSKYDFIVQTIKVIKSHEEKAKCDEEWDSFVARRLDVKDARSREVAFKEKIKNILIDIDYGFSIIEHQGKTGSGDDILEEQHVDPFYCGFDETHELWAWRQCAAIENYFEQSPDLWDLWNSYERPYVYDVGETIDEWRQERIKWCIEQLDI